MIIDIGNEVVKELFGSLKNRYHNNLKSMKGCEFAFDCIIYCIINVRKQIESVVGHV